MVFVFWLAAYTELPSGDIAIPNGTAPELIVGGVMAVKAPVLVLRLYIDRVLAIAFTT